MPKLSEVIRGIKKRFNVKELYVGDTSFWRYKPSNWVPLRVKIKQNHLRILKKKSCISYHFRADVQMYSHQPQYTADNNAAETDVCAVHMSTLSHTSCGKLGKSFVSMDKLRTSQLCVR